MREPTARASRNEARRGTPRSLPQRNSRSLGHTRMLIITEILLFRDGLAHILADRLHDMTIVAAVPDETLAGQLVRLAPDIILADAATIRRTTVVNSIAAGVPTARLVAFAVGDEEDVLACAEARVSSFVGREGPIEDLLVAIESALRGQVWCSPRVAALMSARLAAMAHAPTAGEWLTGRERQVLGLIGQGLANKQIAERLFIEVSTVKNHVHNILDKLRVKHRWQAADVSRRPMPRPPVAP